MKLFSYFCTTESGDDYFGTFSSETKPTDQQLKKALVPTLGKEAEDIWRFEIWECVSEFTIAAGRKTVKKAQKQDTKKGKAGKAKLPSYVLFSETNDNEGETWGFFIPVDGNEEDLEKVRKLIENQTPYNRPYHLDDEPWTEQEASRLVRTRNNTSYMPEFQIATGFKKLPESVDWESDNPFYKGQLIDFEERQPQKSVAKTNKAAGKKDSASAKSKPGKKPSKSAGSLSGKTVVITGRLSVPRSAYEEKIAAAGGINASKVTKRTDFLVCNEPSVSSKYSDARRLGVKVITEKGLQKLL